MVPSSPSQSISTTLLQRIRAHEAAGWERFSRIFTPLVYGWVRKAGLQAEDAADVVQEVFLSVSQRISRFRRDQPEQSFRCWLWTICHYKIRDRFVQLQTAQVAAGGSTAQLDLLQHPFDPLDEAGEASGQEACGLIQRAALVLRQEVNESTWQAFWRTTVDGEAVADVARDLGITPWAVYKARSRLLQRLRQELDGVLDLDRLLG